MGAWTRNFLQGHVLYLMSNQIFENERPLFCQCSLLALKGPGTKISNKIVLIFKDVSQCNRRSKK